MFLKKEYFAGFLEQFRFGTLQWYQSMISGSACEINLSEESREQSMILGLACVYQAKVSFQERRRQQKKVDYIEDMVSKDQNPLLRRREGKEFSRNLFQYLFEL